MQDLCRYGVPCPTLCCKARRIAAKYILLETIDDQHRRRRMDQADQKVCSCLKPTISSSPAPPPGTSKLSKVAFYALGTKGLVFLDTMTVILLMGIIVAYQDAIRSFLHETPIKSGHDTFDAFVIALLIARLSVVPDMGYLAKTSAAGLLILACALLVIFFFGLSSYSSDDSVPIQWYPLNGLVGASHWFGCTVFGFGIVPLTYNFQESMSEPQLLPRVTVLSLMLVATSYIAVGIGLLAMYPNVEADILSELPETGVLPATIRIAMVVVVMVRSSTNHRGKLLLLLTVPLSRLTKATAPIIVVPCAEVIEGRIAHEEANQSGKVKVRFGISLVTGIIGVGIPGFVNILTLVGCFSVAFVSFCIPPFLHIILSRKAGNLHTCGWVKDIAMLVWGLTATGISTVYALKQLLQSRMG
eukprot:scaffold91_cov127-Cylindrotheca_fusiformis.AAC.41